MLRGVKIFGDGIPPNLTGWVYEPYLIQLGFIKRTPRGRVATAHAYDHLGLPVSGRDEDGLGLYTN